MHEKNVQGFDSQPALTFEITRLAMDGASVAISTHDIDAQQGGDSVQLGKEMASQENVVPLTYHRARLTDSSTYTPKHGEAEILDFAAGQHRRRLRTGWFR